METTVKSELFNRDLSWLKFNERILMEAERDGVPLLERIKFLSIFSSNLDEFYRVRMPVLLALEKLSNNEDNDIHFNSELVKTANSLIFEQQQRYGKTLQLDIIPKLKTQNIELVYGHHFPDEIQTEIRRYFLSQVLAFLQPVSVNQETNFFPSNNELYFLVTVQQGDLH
ncbi:polyphosphate kinase 1, partial [bacterium]